MSVSPKSFELILVDIEVDLCSEWEQQFKNHSNVEIYRGRFQSVKEYDCLVSPANSFGLMDGGIDKDIREYYGMKLQYEVQKRIRKEHYGEQLVGTSMIVDTYDDNHPFLAHTPTMRVPKDISNTDNVYKAMFAMLCAVTNFNKESKYPIRKILCPGLGTATGRVSFKEASRQMELAYRNFLNPTTNMNWKNLQERNSEIIN